jgi:tRNA(Ile2)-agmatinylcytidine synthase
MISRSDMISVHETTDFSGVVQILSGHSDESLHIGIDDTDSRSGGCTTHLAFKITERIIRNTNARFVEYPLLIRLNPNVPWKTRGNAAVCFRLRSDTRDQQRIIDIVRHHVETEAVVGSGSDPGVVFFRGHQVPEAIKEFSRTAMCGILSRRDAIRLAKKYNIEYFLLGKGRGIVGSLAAVGCLLEGDHTFEAIAYRRPENVGTPRILESDKIIEYSRSTFPYTFNNFDFTHKRILIAPHGPDPVFCGIRGENPRIVLSFLQSLNIDERLEGCMVFRSNQGTNMHLRNEIKLPEAKSFTSGHIQCIVRSKPHIVQGGHTLFSVENRDGFSMPVAVYEPTGLAKAASFLAEGDVLELGCGVRRASLIHPKILNVEYFMVLELAKVFELRNPACRMCSKNMKSEGKGKGFQCKKCKLRESSALHKVRIQTPRAISTGLYIPTPKAHRHLTKPIHRFGLEKGSSSYSKELSINDNWFILN